MPAAEQRLDRQVASRPRPLSNTSKQRQAANRSARREFEKQVAVIDGRLTRFDEHKAAVKTNQEFTALLHEIETARSGKDDLEEQISGPARRGRRDRQRGGASADVRAGRHTGDTDKDSARAAG